MKERIKIVQVYNNQPSDCADFFYRVRKGAEYFSCHADVEWLDIINFHRDRDIEFLNADLAIINFVCQRDLIHLTYLRKKKNLPTILEINDNFLAFQKDNPMYEFYSDPLNQSIFFRLIDLVDGIQFSSPYFLKLFNINKDYIILLNNIDEPIKTELNSIQNNIINIGWAGSLGHYKDIENVADVLKKIVLKNDNIRLCIKGDSRFFSLFSDLPKEKFYYEEPSDLNGYYNFLKKLNIGLCTIEEDPFNLTRTDIKFLEYVQNGVLPLCKNWGPYSLLPKSVPKFNNKKDLEKHLNYIIRNFSEFNSTFDEIKDYINKNRLEINNFELRFKFYNKFITLNYGKGVYKLLDKMEDMPNLYDFLIGKIDIIKKEEHPLVYLKKYYNNEKKLKMAIKSFGKNSIDLWLAYLSLLYKKNKINEFEKILKIAQLKFPSIIEFQKIEQFIK